MGKREDEFRRGLLAAFKIESEEHLKAISAGLLELEKTTDPERQRTIIEAVFRQAHSFKGAARAANMKAVESVCRSLEGIFAAWKQKEIHPRPDLFDPLYHALDTIGMLLSHPEGGETKVAELIQRLDHLEIGEHEVDSEPEDTPAERQAGLPSDQDEPAATRKPADLTTVRIPTARLDSLLLQTEQMLVVKQALEQRVVDIRDTLSFLDLWHKEWAKIRPEVQNIRKLLARDTGRQVQNCPRLPLNNLLEFLDWNLAHSRSIEDKLNALAGAAERECRLQGGMVDTLLKDMKKALMLPFSSLLESFPRLVRDLAREQSKEVKLVIQGSEVEVDRRILEEMKDAFIHLVRNCIDHGIENPEIRQQSKKPSLGTIVIAVSQVTGSQIEILVSDDGAGIDLARVKETAEKNGILSEKEVRRLNDQEALTLIFESGLSTNPLITDISGRGLGLAIVREKADKLGGQLSVQTEPCASTSFRIILPVTLATFRGALVRAGGQVFVIPTVHIKQVMRIKKDQIITVENREAISLNGRTVSLVRIDVVLEFPRKGEDGEHTKYVPVLILGAGAKSIAFSVDEILNEQEVLVKSLGRQLSRIRNIAGATVLGSGQVVPILNVADLMKSAVAVTAVTARASTDVEHVEAKRESILVAEDSITSRMLLKNILESAGYSVKTAVDGVEAFTILRTEDFDLIVSDVDMPRMDGFDLTAKIRADRKLTELPVVLVTGLESREDRERGIDVGANAYIAKSSFDQSNLLEVIQRLI